MKKLLFILSLFSSIGFSQTNECEQFEKIINYFENDSIFKDHFRETSLRLLVDNEVAGSAGIVWPWIQYEYLAMKYNLERVSDWQELDSTKVDLFLKDLENKSHTDTVSRDLNCPFLLREEKRGQIAVKFYRADSQVIFVWTERIYRKERHSYGMWHLFSFDAENNIIEVFS